MGDNKHKVFATQNYLIIVIGNSRIHWAWFEESTILETWNTIHLSKEVSFDRLPLDFVSDQLIKQKLTDIPIYIASVVPKQTQLWAKYLHSQVLSLKDIKLTNIYPTMGIDRALAAWGGGEIHGYPCLIIDGGTALTFTGINQQQELIGGAILPGLRSQFLTLKDKTAALPKVELPTTLPPRWASNTPDAIKSGIVHTTIAGIYSYITDWLATYADSTIIFTGGDGDILIQYLQQKYTDLEAQLTCDPNLIFKAINLKILEKRSPKSR